MLGPARVCLCSMMPRRCITRPGIWEDSGLGCGGQREATLPCLCLSVSYHKNYNRDLSSREPADALQVRGLAQTSRGAGGTARRLRQRGEAVLFYSIDWVSAL